MDRVYEAGNSVRLECTFTDFADAEVDPGLLKVIFYNQRYEKIEEFSIGPDNKLRQGVYFFDYITPRDGKRKIYYEWYGEIQGLPALKRGSFKTDFYVSS